jgi:hypothetical protein
MADPLVLSQEQLEQIKACPELFAIFEKAYLEEQAWIKAQEEKL